MNGDSTPKVCYIKEVQGPSLPRNDPAMNIQLTEAQATALDQVATAEMRTRQQMLSLLMAEALRFYFIDREPVMNAQTLQPEQLCEDLLNDALEQIQIKEIC